MVNVTLVKSCWLAFLVLRCACITYVLCLVIKLVTSSCKSVSFVVAVVFVVVSFVVVVVVVVVVCILMQTNFEDNATKSTGMKSR